MRVTIQRRESSFSYISDVYVDGELAGHFHASAEAAMTSAIDMWELLESAGHLELQRLARGYTTGIVHRRDEVEVAPGRCVVCTRATCGIQRSANYRRRVRRQPGRITAGDVFGLAARYGSAVWERTVGEPAEVTEALYQAQQDAAATIAGRVFGESGRAPDDVWAADDDVWAADLGAAQERILDDVWAGVEGFVEGDDG